MRTTGTLGSIRQYYRTTGQSHQSSNAEGLFKCNQHMLEFAKYMC